MIGILRGVVGAGRTAAIVAAVSVLHGCGILLPAQNEPAAEPALAETMPAPSPAPRVARSVAASPPATMQRPPVGPKLTLQAPSATLPRANTGRYFQDDGPGSIPPERLQDVPEPTPRNEPLADFANRNYVVFGRAYAPETERRIVRERGIASWYGKKFHGRKTATGEKYDMYSMSAAHPTLPLPSFVRVTNLENKRSVIVRVNDRGPFLNGRLIDVSYAAAAKLGFANKGSVRVEIETVLPATTLAANGAKMQDARGSGLVLRN